MTSGFYPTRPEMASAGPGRGCWFGIFKLLLSQLLEEVAQALQSHILEVKIEAQREISVGGLQMHFDQVADSSFQLSEIMLSNVGALG